ncbi:hypothetical protein ACFOZ5_09385 [Marinobacter lacisalsi]|uniref:Uncharacterized protein n=1 Tax=Marinobacter lacisalsi TaxID=475979 RepID=A0ABV8QGU5_9GAMM
MSSSALLHSFLRLLALTLLPSALAAWGAADLLSAESDQRFQVSSVEECLSLAARVDDSNPDDTPDEATLQHPPNDLSPGLQTTRIGFHPSTAHLLSDPGLPRAPPA